jgi:hypothetical protein
MKKLYIALLLLVAGFAGQAQILNPVKFTYTAKKTGANEYEVRIKAAIDNSWHMYSAYNPEAGAGPTLVTFSGIEKVGLLKEVGKIKTIYDKNFKTNQKYFENTVDFVQVVKVKAGAKKVEGAIEYIVCNDKKCLPPKEVPFEIKL